jgi:hypothetical protein
MKKLLFILLIGYLSSCKKEEIKLSTDPTFCWECIASVKLVDIYSPSDKYDTIFITNTQCDMSSNDIKMYISNHTYIDTAYDWISDNNYHWMQQTRGMKCKLK